MNEDNPWKVLSSQIKYENPWIRVREDAVVRPDGKNGIYGVVETRIATGVLALTESQELYIVGQYRYPLACYSWEIIEGGSDPGESALVTAQRELKEEAGLVAERWRQLGGVIHLSNCHSSEVGYLFVAEDLSQVGSTPDATEVLQIKKIHFSEALRMVMAGEMTDSLTIIGILRLARELETVVA